MLTLSSRQHFDSFALVVADAAAAAALPLPLPFCLSCNRSVMKADHLLLELGALCGRERVSDDKRAGDSRHLVDDEFSSSIRGFLDHEYRPDVWPRNGQCTHLGLILSPSFSSWLHLKATILSASQTKALCFCLKSPVRLRHLFSSPPPSLYRLSFFLCSCIVAMRSLS